jgi:disulfide bond formation protein DsbB
MTFYSDFARRRAWQIIADVLAVVLIVVFIGLGIAVHGLVLRLQDFGVQMQDAGASFESTMNEIGDRLGSVPLIGGGIRSPFDDASSAGTTLHDAGQAQQEAVQQLSMSAGLAVALVPIAVILFVWLIPRIRFFRRARWAKAALASPGGVDLLALRALSARALPEIARAHPDAAEGWRSGDPEVILVLADLELRARGVRRR